jgi:outer membrane protein insertion porin family
VTLLGASGPSRPAAAQTGELPEELRTIADVRFRGLRHLGRRPIAGAWVFGRRSLTGIELRTHRPSGLPWRERPLLRRDYLLADSAAIVAYYRHYGYLDAAVNVHLQRGHDPRSAIVVFDVREGPLTRIASVSFEGVHVYADRELRRAVLAQAREPFDPVFLQLDAAKLRSLYFERGYRAQVDTSARRGEPDSAHVAIRYRIDEGPRYHVGTIEYLRTGRVRESLGRRELLLKPGDVFRRSRLDRSIERLYGTGLFRQVQVSDFWDSTTATANLSIAVTDRPSRWLDLGVGSGTTNRYQLNGQWGHRNLDTRALSGVLDGQLARDGQNHPRTEAASGTLGEPWLFGVRLQGQTSLFYRRDHDRGNPNFVQNVEQRGFNFTLFRELGRIARVTLVQQNTFVRQNYQLLRDTALTVQDSLARSVVPRYRTNTLRLTFERDMRNDRINPSRGSYQVLSAELAGGPLSGTSSYSKSVFSSTWYTPLPNGWQLATRATGGLMQPFGDVPANFSPEIGADSLVARVPRESRFFIGGVNSLRGYGENSVTATGGLAMALANVELRVPLVGPFGLEAFVDAGNVWDRPEYIRARDLVAPWQATRTRRGDVRYSYGVGARLVLPFGPLRIDLAWSDRPDFPRGGHVPFAYQFAIGPSF